ncbi:MAG TPA: porin [Caulobacterales bacterium]|nr:porin [Caulobacterales bacterium]
MSVRTWAALGASWLALAGVAAAQQANEPVQTNRVTPEDPRDARIRDLEHRLEDIEAALNDLKASTAADSADIRTIQSSAPQVTLNNGRPTFASADGAFKTSIRGLFQFDSATYNQDPGANVPATTRDLDAGTNFRRARIGLEGTVFRDWNYAITYEGGGSGVEASGLQQAWLEYAGWKPFGLTAPVRIRVGGYAVETNLQGATSNTDQLFLERPSIAEIVRSTFGGDGRSAVGVFANGDHLFVNAAVTGGLIGNTDAQAGPYDEQTGFSGRVGALLFAGPDSGLHLGANYSAIFQLPDIQQPGQTGLPGVLQLRDRPELRVDGTRLIDTGVLSATGAESYGIELGGQWKNFFAAAEWEQINVARPNGLPDAEFNGWYVNASWALTGEQRRWSPTTGGFGGIRPTNAFDLRAGHWGAFELAVGYSYVDLNSDERAATPANTTYTLVSGGTTLSVLTNRAVRGGEQEITTLGLNWYPNSVVRFTFEAQSVDVDRLSSAASPVQIGQSYDAFSLRTQVSF